jgi:hypothetical protein
MAISRVGTVTLVRQIVAASLREVGVFLVAMGMLLVIAIVGLLLVVAPIVLLLP